jgi:hypothetical protein
MGTRSEVQKSGIGQASGRFGNDRSNGSSLKGDLAELVNKVRGLESEIAQEKGAFGLFGLVLRAGSQDRWDLVASAKWFSDSRSDELRYLSEKLKKTLLPDELIKISRIVPMHWRDDFVEEMQGRINIEHGLFELENVELAGVEVKRAFIVTSRRPGAGRLAG